MDPLVVAGAQVGHAMLVDFATLDVEHVQLPDGVAVVVVHSGEARRLIDSPYGARRSECAAAAAHLGQALGRATEADVSTLTDPVLRRRARHVVTEGGRVRAMAVALREGDPATAGRLMTESHRSLSGDFDASTPTVDALVDTLLRRPGVHGARMTGGGFGGCVVALTRPGAVDPAAWPGRAWAVRPSAGVSRQVRRAG
jgi:galactokinase